MSFMRYPKNFKANGWGWHRTANAAAAVKGFLSGERGEKSDGNEPLLGNGSLYPTLPAEDDTVFTTSMRLYPALPVEVYEGGAVEEVIEESCSAVNVNAMILSGLAPSSHPGARADHSGVKKIIASSAEQQKRRKYVSLGRGYIFEPFGVETLRPWGLEAHLIFQNLSKRLVDATRDLNAGLFLAQRISIAIQRGNAASMLGTLTSGSGLKHLDYL